MRHRPRKRNGVAALVFGFLPPSRRGHASRSRSTTRPAVEFLEGRTLLTSSVIGNVTMPYDGTLSAAVYDPQGHLVKSLLQGATETMGQKVNLTWDGTDQSGNPVPNNLQYQWRAAFSQAGGTYQGEVGNSGSPSFGIEKANGGTAGVAVDPSGAFYSVSWWEETHNELRKYSADGSTLWEVPAVGGYGGITADPNSVYVAISASQNGGEDRIYRYSSAAGDPVNFSGTGTNYITVNTGRTNDGVEFDWEPLHGMAVDSTDLFVSDYVNNRVDVYDKNSGAVVAQFPVSHPLGIAVQSEPTRNTPGGLWVANGGNTVTQYAFTVQNGTYTFTATGKQVANLSNPYGVAIGGPSGDLYVTELSAATNDVREYDISGPTPVLSGLKVFGHLASPGPVTDTGFRALGAIAVDATGSFIVSDPGNRRLMTYNPDGTTLWSAYGEFQPNPSESPGSVPGMYELTSGPWEYQVDASGASQAGWMGDGTWRLADNWEPADGQFASTVAQKLTFTVNGVSRDYIYYLGGNYGGAAVYQVNSDGSGFRRSAVVGTDWVGTTGTATPDGGRYVWTDSDGNSQVESGEVNWNMAEGLSSGAVLGDSNLWVDSSGAIWFGNMAGQTVKLPLLGFDSDGNPLYDWSKLQTVVTTLGLAGLTPNQTRVANNGDVYEVGNPVYFFNGGRTINRYGSNGNLLTQLVLPGKEETAGLAVSPDSNYFFAGENASGFGYDGGRSATSNNWIDMYTSDGLRVATIDASPSAVGAVGWFDDGMALASFASGGRLFVAGENVLYGNTTIYQVNGLSTIGRLSGSFSWPQDPTVVTIAATTPVGTVQGSQPATFTVTRSNTSGPLTVYYAASGTATQADYQQNLISIPSFSGDFDTMNVGGVNGQGGWGGTPTDVVEKSVAVSGNALAVNSMAYYLNPFPAGAAPAKHLSFDFRLATDIHDYVGTPNATIQDIIMDVDGPVANGADEFLVVYRASTDSGGNVNSDQLQLRGANTSYAVGSPDLMNGMQKGVWYHVTMAIDFADGTATATVQAAGSAPWTSGTVTGLNNGNTNGLEASGSAPFYLDNIQVVAGQNPAGEGSVTIPDGQASATISVTPIEDAQVKGDKTLRLLLQPNYSYVVGGSGEDAVTLIGNDAPAPAFSAPVVTVTANPAPGQSGGAFTFTRTGTFAGALTVKYTVRGSADPLGYSPALTGTVTIPAGQTSQTVTVAPVQGAPAAENGGVVVSLSADPAGLYAVGTRSVAALSISAANAAAPVVIVNAPAGTVSKQGAQPGTFVVSRTGNTAGALTVSYILGGTSPAGSYLVNGITTPGPGVQGSVIIPAGQSSATVTVTPVNDGLVTGDRSVQIVLGAGAAYSVGAQGNDVLVIHDNLLPTVSISAVRPNAVSTTGAPGAFVVSRNSTAGNLTVHYTVGGTATAEDYNEPLTDITKQNFDALKPGAVNGQGGWLANSWDSVVENRVAVAGNALYVTGAGAAYPDAFLPAAQAPTQVVSFDFRLATDIHDYAGTPNATIQDIVMEARGPDANASNWFLLVYRASTDQYGNVNSDQLQLRGANTSYAVGSPDLMNGMQKGVWYHVTMAIDFADGTATATVQAAGSAPWTSGTVTGLSNGNTNLLASSGSSPFYLDNVQVDEGLSPSNSGTVTIPDGRSSAEITVTPASGGAIAAGQTVQLALAGDPGYTLGSQTQGLVTIASAAVPQASKTSVVPSSAGASSFGQPLTFTATVTAASPSGTTPTGPAVLLDGANVIAMSTLNASGVATFTVGPLAVGSHTLTAAYQGDGVFLGSTSGAAVQQVDRAWTTSTITSTSGTPVYGQPVTFTATVSPSAPGSGGPSGTVTFFEGTTRLGSSALGADGTARFTVSSLRVTGGTPDAVSSVYGGDGSFGPSTAPAVSETVLPAGTTAMVTGTPGPSVYGQRVMFTAAVSTATPAPGAPIGSVTFMDGTTALATVVLDASGHATLSLPVLAAGDHPVTVVYSGDTGFATATSAAYVQSVGRATTAVAVAAGAPPVLLGQPVTLTATVAALAPGRGEPSGSITFRDGTAVIGSAAVDGSGTARLILPTLAAGTHGITASYQGDSNFLPRTSPAAVWVVRPAATSTTLVASSGSAVTGQSVTFTAVVATTSPNSGTPAGTVSFMDGPAVLAVAAVDDSGVAAFTTRALAVGRHPVTAAYGGGGNFLGGASAPTTLTINPDATSATLTTAGGSTPYGQKVVLSALVAAAAPGSGTPTGRVAFVDGTATVLGYGVLDASGRAVLAVAPPGVGPHSIRGVYQGDASFASSASTPVVRTVTPDQTATALTSSGASVVGQAVTFTAAITVAPTGTAAPTGTVTFRDGTAVLGTVASSGGFATLTSRALAGGAHAITATYNGDPASAPSQASLRQSVAPSPTVTTLAGPTAAPVNGQKVVLTASVAAAAAGFGPPTGVVAFADGPTSLGSAPIVNGRASLTVILYSVSLSHALTATYHGDANFLGSSSTPLSMLVKKAGTVASLTAAPYIGAVSKGVALIASLGVAAPGAGQPGGIVVYYANGKAFATRSLVKGRSTVVVPTSQAIGTTYKVVYSGDADDTASASSAVVIGKNYFGPAPRPAVLPAGQTKPGK